MNIPTKDNVQKSIDTNNQALLKEYHKAVCEALEGRGYKLAYAHGGEVEAVTNQDETEIYIYEEIVEELGTHSFDAELFLLLNMIQGNI